MGIDITSREMTSPQSQYVTGQSVPLVPLEPTAVPVDFLVRVSDLARELAEAELYISPQDAENLYLASLELEEDELLLLFAAATGLDRTTRSVLLETLTRTGDDTRDYLLLMGSLNLGERKQFVRMGSRSGDIAILIDNYKELDHEQRLSLGNLATNLTDLELDHLLVSVGHDLSRTSELLDLVLPMKGQERSDFLSAASHVGRGLGQLLDVMPEQNEGRKEFLSLAAKAEDKVPEYIVLRRHLDPVAKNGFVSLARKLGTSEFQDFLTASAKNDFNITDLLAFGEKLHGETRALFLSNGASTTGELSKYFAAVASLSDQRGSLSNFLVSMDKVGAAANALLDFTLQNQNELLDKVLGLTAELSSADLHNFLASSSQSGQVVRQLLDVALDLGGEERSLLLYDAKQAGDKIEVLLDTVVGLDGLKRHDFLMVAAHGDSAVAIGKLSTIARNDNPEVEKALAHRAGELETSGFGQGRYVYMSSILGGEEIDDLALAMANIEGQDERDDFLLAVNEQDDPSTLLKVASRAGDQTTQFVFLKNRLDEELFAHVLETATTLASGDVSRYLKVAGDFMDDAKLSNFVDLVDDLDGNEKKKFLAVAEYIVDLRSENFGTSGLNSRDLRDDFIATTTRIKGGMRTLFLTSAAHVAEARDPEVLNGFLAWTNEILDAEIDHFQQKAKSTPFADLLKSSTGQDGKTHFYLAGDGRGKLFDMFSSVLKIPAKHLKVFMAL